MGRQEEGQGQMGAQGPADKSSKQSVLRHMRTPGEEGGQWRLQSRLNRGLMADPTPA